MPDHFHAVLVLPEDKTLSDVVRRLKCVTASITNRTLGRHGPLWSATYHDHAVRAEEDLHDIVEYALANPIRAGICTDLRDYPYLYSRHDSPD